MTSQMNPFILFFYIIFIFLVGIVIVYGKAVVTEVIEG